jgi:hypothetical protein
VYPPNPLIAYGCSGNGRTSITVISSTPSGGWSTVATHAPQYNQTYDDTFVFRVRGGVAYVGVSELGYGSVLRAGAVGYDEFDGSWAFFATEHSWTYAIDVAGGGDMRLLAWTGNPTMATTSSTVREQAQGP